MSSFSISAKLVDVHQQRIYPAEITIENKRISRIRELYTLTGTSGGFILPGFIDSHVHIESSMLVPSEFARLAVVHGTVGTVSDPHEIANVCGMDGVEFMIRNGRTVPFKFNFGAPSCVPATVFETAGASITADDVQQLLARDEVRYLSEMMNFPGVLHGDSEVMKKIDAALALGKPVDGHAPGLRGEEARRYIEALPPGSVGNAAGPTVRISTDHECFTRDEALDKLNLGMKIIIREGSAAKNFDALIDLLHDHPGSIMFCSDDKHPDSLVIGHINQLCARAVDRGIDLFKVLAAACVNPVQHYKLQVGLVREGDPADLILVNDLQSFQVLQTYIDGELVAKQGQSLIKAAKSNTINNFSCSRKQVEDFEIRVNGPGWITKRNGDRVTVPVIEALDGQLITNRIEAALRCVEGVVQTNTDEDTLKIVVVNRYKDAPVARAFVRNFGFKRGAIASSVAHDSHNIVAVGVDDESICGAVNLLIDSQGGVSYVDDNNELVLPLPVAGLMSNEDGYHVAEQYSLLDQAARDAGSALGSPFMTLSFMALLVIPHLKLSDLGLFDGDRFTFV